MLASQELNQLVAARAGDQEAFSRLTEPYRRELLVHCYRLLGSVQEAEDLVQETLLRAWRRLDTFQRYVSFRAWLYKIATNVCLDALDKRPKRTLPAVAYPASDPREMFASPITEPIWLEPFPDELLVEAATGPEARYLTRESISLAFLVVLQILPPRQRAVLIMRDVLDWSANEVAEILDLTVPAVNSALHRARTTLAKHYGPGRGEEVLVPPDDEKMRALLDRYVHAWETADVAGLVALLKEDASFTMPPIPTWYLGREAIRTFLVADVFPDPSLRQGRFQPIRANAQPAFALYHRDDSSGLYIAYGIQVLTVDRRMERIAEIITFINPELFPAFGLPTELNV